MEAPPSNYGGLTDERLRQYMSNRFGQRDETRARYAEAIVACGSILFLDKTISEIARIFGHQAESLRNQLKRHFPELVAERERLRSLLNMSKQPVRGVGMATMEKYGPAINLLRTTSLTIREVAEKTGVSVTGLHQHLLFYHKDIAEQRFARRIDALQNPRQGEINASGGRNEPRDATRVLYANAVEMYRTTDMPLEDIAIQCGFDPHNLKEHIRKWYSSDMSVRKKLRSEKVEAMRREREERKARSRVCVAERKYLPAIPLIENGATYAEAARATGVPVDRLAWWMRHHRTDVHERARQNGWVTLSDGTRIMRQKWLKYQEAERAFCNTDEPVKHIARRLGVSATSLLIYLHHTHPEVVERRRNATGEAEPEQ